MVGMRLLPSTLTPQSLPIQEPSDQSVIVNERRASALDVLAHYYLAYRMLVCACARIASIQNRLFTFQK